MNLPAWWTIDPVQPFTLGPRLIPGRIWTASGCFAYGLTAHEVTAVGFDSPYQGIGAVVTKTVTPQPRSGNPMPRLSETRHGAINSIGLENVGFDSFLADVLPELEKRGVPTVVSLAATRPAEFGDMAARLHESASGYAHWHGVEVNLSCPNVAEGGHDFGRDPSTVADCVSAARGQLPEDKTKLINIMDRFLNLPKEDRINFTLGRRLGAYQRLDDLHDHFLNESVAEKLNQLNSTSDEQLETIFHSLRAKIV